MFKQPILSEQEQQQKSERPNGVDSLPLKKSIAAFCRILTPYWKSRQSLKGWFYLVLIVSLTSGAIYLATAINSWYKRFWDTIQNYDVDGFKHELMIFAILATIHVLVSVYNAYLRSRLAIHWRRCLTGNVMGEWLENSTYYKMQLLDRKTENPDQRIAEDLNAFVTRTISLLLGTATDLAMLVTFGVVLWDLSHSVTLTLWNDSTITLPDGYMLYLALVYAVAGTLLTFIIGKPLVKLNFRQQRYEADFRFSLIRVRENAESISLYKGEKIEEEILRKRFFNVVGNYVRLIIFEKRLGFFTLGYAQLAVIFPILVAAPMYFAKIITMGSIMQINSAFGRVQDSLSTLVSNFSSWAAFKADVDRLALYFDSMYVSEQVQCLKSTLSTDHGVHLYALEVRTPQGQRLCSELSASLSDGDRLLIRGQSGCGKSTLLKTIAGIWPYATGKVELPEVKTLFLSQRPYLPQGTLREAAAYPDKPETGGLTERYFEQLGLSHLIEKLDEEDVWSQILSLGEQQRVAMVRALLLKPGLLFLDEASSAMDERSESTSYALIEEVMPKAIVVSVGHRSSLIERHNRQLLCRDAGHWELA